MKESRQSKSVPPYGTLLLVWIWRAIPFSFECGSSALCDYAMEVHLYTTIGGTLPQKVDIRVLDTLFYFGG